MTTLVVYGDTTDGYISSQDAVYTNARDGLGTLNPDTGSSTALCGQNTAGGPIYSCNESFVAFDLIGVDTSAVMSAAALSLWVSSDSSTTDFTVEARAFDWGASLTNADFRTAAQLGALTLVASRSTSAVVAASYLDLTDVALVANLTVGLVNRFVLCSDRHTAGTTPTTAEYLTFSMANAAGTTQDPKLTLTITLTSSDNLLNPWVDVTDGTWTTEGGGSTLYGSVNEDAASDSDYIQSAAGPVDDTVELALEGATDPLSSSGHIVHYRYQKNISGGAVDLTAEFRQGIDGGYQRLTTNQQGLESGSTGWVAGTNCTVSQSALQAHGGSNSLAMTSTGSGHTAYTTTGTGAVPITPGREVHASVWIRAAVTARTCFFKLRWYDSGGALLSGSVLQSRSDSSSAWTFYSGSATAPALAAYVGLEVEVAGSIAAEIHYVDDASLKTAIAAWQHTGISSSWVTADQTLSSTEADTITDYNDLRLRFIANMTASDTTPTKVADRQTANSNSGVTTVDLVLSGLTVGNTLMIRSAADNSGGGGAARSFAVSNQSGTAVDTTLGLQDQRNNDPGAASAGTTANVWTGDITATSGTVRITYGGSVVQACVAEEWSGILSGAFAWANNPITNVGTASTNLASMTDTLPALGELLYGVEAVEGPTSDTYTQDSDTTNGSWSDLTKLGTSNATATDNQTVYGGYKVVTAAGSQTYNPTINNARDSAGILVRLTPKAATIRARVSWAQLELPTVDSSPHRRRTRQVLQAVGRSANW